MHIILRAQTGKSDYVSVTTDKGLHQSIAGHLSMNEAEFDKEYSLVFSGNLLTETDSFPKDLSEGSTVVLLHKTRNKILLDDEPEPNGELNIQALIDQEMKKYAKPDIVISLDEEKVTMLMEMGFTEGRVRRALILSYSDTEAALNWLLSHTDDPSADDPLSQRELRAIARAEDNFTPDEEKLNNLIEMGFSRELSIQALKLNKNSFEAAFAWLTGDSSPNVGIGGNDPQIAAIMREIVAHPARLRQYIDDPQIGPVLMEILRNVRSQ
eukprot:CAMPEP_0117035692 /NCGR_PEP_ID=MMETSP0472-20121206/25336_1 /TAXON_ID=693140 ORGANISM="Tiarina fusus, Strain LIS" /NCGR_SAMPLE_ID=MMETSP0472 /ASSEMBLY_ACC=CAM_ASM_000603 /LENGTH=267 /DNA_ID=CAMNT_0004745243 /DNA_START=11 /DNA_END=814 /DNA_ORIENTATION=-